MRVVTSVLLALLIYPVYGQITYSNNHLRAGDEIVKQQVEYKDPGRQGENVIWDFSQLKAINDEYRLTYSAPVSWDDSLYVLGKDTILVDDVSEGDLVIGTEHYTKYFYRHQNNMLRLLGFKNPVSQMHNMPAIPVVSYPLAYRQKIEDTYNSESIYSGTEYMDIRGSVSVEGDAMGIMILPNKDTLHHVFRIRTVQTMERVLDSLDITDSVPPFHTQIETYRWYEKGYRYPIFETVRNTNLLTQDKEVYFTTAFFYPPQEHYYLDTDDENLAVLDSLDQQPNTPDTENPISWIEKNFSYNFFPNPVSTTLNIEYKLEEGAEIGITLYSVTHGLVKDIPTRRKEAGVHTATMDCSDLFPGSYALKFVVNGEHTGSILIKK
ncbi:hypothetical protein M2132_002231 [Dysgonomonas sp. PH5-45]|uniref:T9SS C-terminal target domain-containing protein n=1 Tax=unclassified Dysgonomonas TaxID=2630389 RepID=UPI0024751A2E|nr:MULTISPECIES: T9SS C-terminal target domain-containing protein [unclassified Dysgonomonas]MDH6355881.1 hypothetical protein [Dysgonomonas sp. PH5-45]MDH6388776.1 hypothetical protein [Dysgonomonas sp. PH5-37]